MGKVNIEGDPIAVALEYVANRNEQINRYRGSHGALFQSATRRVQLDFIEYCNMMSTRFADQFPNNWTVEDWAEFSVLDMPLMNRFLSAHNCRRLISNLAEWEGMSELSKTYLALLRMRLTP